MKKLRSATAACLFLVTVAVAIWKDWAAADLVWASWISGVVVGLGLAILSLASFCLLQGDMRFGCAMLLLLLFVLPWGFLQAAMAALLNAAFPLPGKPADLSTILRTTLASYWPLVLLSAASEFSSLQSYWSLAGGMAKRGSYPVLVYGQFVSAGRMFLLVWLLASLWCAGLTGYALYPALIFYFFPWDAISWRALFGRNQGIQPSPDPDQLVLRFGGGFFSAVGWPALLAGIFFMSLPFWRQGLQGDEASGFHTIAVVTGLALGLAGVVLVFGRCGITTDRRKLTLTKWLALGILRPRWTHSLKGIESVRIRPVWATGNVRVDDSEKLMLTGRDGVARFHYEVWLMGGGRDLLVYSFSLGGLPKARELAEALAAMLNLQLVEEPADTASSSQAARREGLDKQSPNAMIRP